MGKSRQGLLQNKNVLFSYWTKHTSILNFSLWNSWKVCVPKKQWKTHLAVAYSSAAFLSHLCLT